jgi:hypothetical protein
VVTVPAGGTVNKSFGVRPVSAAWLKTTSGSVGSRSGISFSRVAPSGQYNASYLVIAKLGLVNNFNSAKSWLIHNYQNSGEFAATPPYRYADLYNKFSGDICQISSSNGPIPNATGKFVTTGSFTTSGTPSGGTNCGSGKDATVIFVNGSLSITSDLNYTRPTVFIVKDDILIDSAVTRINAVLLADKSFSDRVGSSQLQINGALLAALDGSSSLSLLRDLGVGNDTNPAEQINFDPRYYYLLSDYIGDSRMFYKEEKP